MQQINIEGIGALQEQACALCPNIMRCIDTFHEQEHEQEYYLGKREIMRLATLEEQAYKLNIDIVKMAQEAEIDTEIIPKIASNLLEHTNKAINLVEEKQSTETQSTIIINPIQVNLLIQKQSVFGTTIAREAIELGEALNIKELTELDEDSGIKKYLMSRHNSGEIYELPSKTSSHKTVHLSVFKNSSDRLINKYMYLSILDTILSSPILNSIKSDHNRITFKCLIPYIKPPIVHKGYTDILTAFITTKGKHTADDIERITDQLMTVFFRLNDHTAIMQQYMHGNPQIQVIDSTKLNARNIVYIVMSIILEIPSQKREALLKSNDIRPMSFLSGTEIPTSKILQKISPLKFSVITNTTITMQGQMPKMQGHFRDIDIVQFTGKSINKASEVFLDVNNSEIKTKYLMTTPSELDARLVSELLKPIELDEELDKQEPPSKLLSEEELDKELDRLDAEHARKESLQKEHQYQN